MKDMKIYEVTFKGNVIRYYGFDEECKIGDTVVAGTSHGPLLGRVSDVLDELPDHLDADKMRFILCRVPAENKLAAELRTTQLMKNIEETEQKMDEIMARQKKEVMRRVFAEYSDDFSSLYADWCDMKAELAELEDEDPSDDDGFKEDDSEEKADADENDDQADKDGDPSDLLEAPPQ